MTFRATNQVTADAYASIKREAADSKAYLTAQVSAMQQPTCPSSIPFSVIQHLSKKISSLDSLAAVPGLATYAQGQENDQTYDVVAEYQNMRNGMANVRTQMISMFPKDGSGFLLFQSLDANGNIVYRFFTSADLAAVVSLLNQVIATIS